MEKQDLRIRRTYKLLRDALIELIQEKPFEKISVTNICDRAMVHRATFYAHFEDKYQLLEYCVRDLLTVFDEIPVTEHSVSGYKEYFMNVARRILEHMLKHRDVYVSFLKQNNATFEQIMSHDIYEKLCVKYDSCIKHGVKLDVPKEIFASYYSGACSSLAIWWVKNDMPISPEELVVYLDVMTERQ